MCPADGSGQICDQLVIRDDTHFKVIHHVGKAFPKAANNMDSSEYMEQKRKLISDVLGMGYPEGISVGERARIRCQRIHAINTHYPYNPLIHNI